MDGVGGGAVDGVGWNAESVRSSPRARGGWNVEMGGSGRALPDTHS